MFNIVALSIRQEIQYNKKPLSCTLSEKSEYNEIEIHVYFLTFFKPQFFALYHGRND